MCSRISLIELFCSVTELGQATQKFIYEETVLIGLGFDRDKTMKTLQDSVSSLVCLLS